jgi:predicted permease
MINDLKFAFRQLRKSPGFTLTAVLTLALGIGANTAIFSLVDSIMLRPLPYPHQDQLMRIESGDVSPFPKGWIRALGEHSDSFAAVSGFGPDAESNVAGSDSSDRVFGATVMANALDTLGIHPLVGSFFTRDQEQTGQDLVIVLSYGYWQQRFGQDPNVIGQTIRIDGISRRIVGVMPAGVRFPYADTQFVVPVAFKGGVPMDPWRKFDLRLFGRLKDGVTPAQAQAELHRLHASLLPLFPWRMPDTWAADLTVVPLLESEVGATRPRLLLLWGSVGFILLIACANVANLLLVRVEGRRQELAIRAALGAGSKRIATDLLVESFTLGAIGSLIGLGLAYGALRVLVAMAPTGLPRLQEIGINLPVLAFTFAIMVLTSVLIGAIPVLRYAKADSNLTLREGGRGQSQSREQHRTRNALVVLQVALALMLLICSGLMIRTFNAMMHVAPGFDKPDSLQTFRLDIPETTVPDTDKPRVIRMEQAIRDKIAALPGVTSVAFGGNVPMDGWSSNDVLYAQDRTYAEGQLPPIRRFKFISPGYFSTLGTPLIVGRDYTWDDVYHKMPVAIISENFAREYWHDPANALGKRLREGMNDEWREIVGVVADTYDDGVSQAAPTAVYWPVLMSNFQGDTVRAQRGISMVIRSSRAGSQAFMKEVQGAVWSTDSNLPLADPHTVGYLYTRSMARTSFTLIMLSVAGGMALLLGVVGIYGVISYSVSQRTREIGIRMALGAQVAGVQKMIVGQGMKLAAIALLLGLGAAFAVARLFASFLYGVRTDDALTFVTVPVLLGFVVLIASWIPARRAARVDPMVALRWE